MMKLIKKIAYILFLSPAIIFAFVLGVLFYFLSFRFVSNANTVNKTSKRKAHIFSFLGDANNRSFLEFLAILLWMAIGFNIVTEVFSINLLQLKPTHP